MGQKGILSCKMYISILGINAWMYIDEFFLELLGGVTIIRKVDDYGAQGRDEFKRGGEERERNGAVSQLWPQLFLW